MLKKWRNIKITEFCCEEHSWTRNVFQCTDCRKFFCSKCESPYYRGGIEEFCVECFTKDGSIEDKLTKDLGL